MLFMTISNPRPERPSTQLAARKQFWPWMDALLAGGSARWCYARPGRGAVALLDVTSAEALHALLNQWAEMIPAQFDIYPLLDADNARAFLAKGNPAATATAQKTRSKKR
jgi:hypothetical protein